MAFLLGQYSQAFRVVQGDTPSTCLARCARVWWARRVAPDLRTKATGKPPCFDGNHGHLVAGGPKLPGSWDEGPTNRYRQRPRPSAILASVGLQVERREVADACRRMLADGLVVGTSGNISVRAGDLVAVSPSGLDYDEMTPALVGVHRLAGSPVDAPLEPTSELPMHLAVYAR